MLPETKPTTIRHLRVAAIRTDPHVQRQLTPGRVAEIKRSFDLFAVGVITVSQRADGDHYVIDGQHRLAAMVELGRGQAMVEAKVYEHLTIAEEARLFVLLNNTAKPKRLDRFQKSVIAGDPVAVAINDIVEANGFKVAPHFSPGNIRAVESLEMIYRGDHRLSATYHPEELAQTLEILGKAWSFQPIIDGSVVHGMGLFVLRYKGRFDQDALVAKLTKEPGGPEAILGKARTFRTVHGGKVARNVAGVITELYNRGRRSGALPDWWSKH